MFILARYNRIFAFLILLVSSTAFSEIWIGQPAYTIDQPVSYFDASPNSNEIALVSGSDILIYDRNDFHWIRTFPTNFSLRNLIYSPDGTLLLSSNDPGAYSPGDGLLFDSKTGQLLRTFPGVLRGNYESAFSPDGKQVVFAGENSQHNFYDCYTSEKIGSLEAGWGAFAFTPDSRRMCIVNNGSQYVSVCDIPALSLLYRLAMPGEGFVPELASSVHSVLADSRFILVGTLWGNVHQFDLSNGELVRTFSGIEGNVKYLDVSPDGQFLAAGGGSNLVYLFDFKNNVLLAKIVADSTYIYPMRFLPNSRFLAAVGSEGILKIWKLDALQSSFDYWQFY